MHLFLEGELSKLDPRSEIFPVKINREKDVPGLFRRFLFLVSAKRKSRVYPESGILGTTWGHFNRENLRARMGRKATTGTDGGDRVTCDRERRERRHGARAGGMEQGNLRQLKAT